MPHQDTDDLRTPLHELKAVTEPLQNAGLDKVQRHGNASVKGMSLAVLALLTFGWNRKESVSERFEFACQATVRLIQGAAVCRSRQGLFNALRACGEELFLKVRQLLVDQLEASDLWRLIGRPTFAVDGSQFAVPRTKSNLKYFAAAGRKSKAAYKKASDHAKAKTTQIALSMCLHLGSGLPFLWNTGGSSDSERGLLLQMIDRLPKGARLVMDAYYFGYAFWNKLIDSDLMFVVRAGSNIELLSELREGGKVKCRGNLVLYWPQTVIDTGGDPIVLSMAEVMVGRKRMFLLTNELDLSDQELSQLYAMRWGVETFFRTVKQTYEHSKLDCRTAENATIELHWVLLGAWMALTVGGKEIPAGKRLSPIKVMRVLSLLVMDVARYSALKLSLSAKLSECHLADESGRKSSKNSDSYPRKKKKKQTGEPKVKPVTEKFWKQAMEALA